MTATYTLTGRLLDDSRRALPGLRLTLTCLPALSTDTSASETYAAATQVTTDSAGHLVRVLPDGRPSPIRGVRLLVGYEYTLSGDPLGSVSFLKATTGRVDLAQIINGDQDGDGVLDAYPSIGTYPAIGLYPRAA